MACSDCDKKNKVITVCRVCELVDGDTTEKSVAFCKDCVAYICENCWNDPVKRAKAATKSGIIAFKNIVKGWFKK